MAKDDIITFDLSEETESEEDIQKKLDYYFPEDKDPLDLTAKAVNAPI